MTPKGWQNAAWAVIGAVYHLQHFFLCLQFYVIVKYYMCWCGGCGFREIKHRYYSFPLKNYFHCAEASLAQTQDLSDVYTQFPMRLVLFCWLSLLVYPQAHDTPGVWQLLEFWCLVILPRQFWHFCVYDYRTCWLVGLLRWKTSSSRNWTRLSFSFTFAIELKFTLNQNRSLQTRVACILRLHSAVTSSLSLNFAH